MKLGEFQEITERLGLGESCLPMGFTFRSLVVVPVLDAKSRLLCWLSCSCNGSPRDLADARYLADAPVWVVREAHSEREGDAFEADFQGVGLIVKGSEGLLIRVRPSCVQYRPRPLSDAVRAVLVPTPHRR